ncbi:branched-Chain alpha-keto acid dehydrogenase subunit E2 [Arthrobacter sp. Hiyo6]|nr:branched-Chain alpha-keto acid dehydrogenase subunit E2 [Arthrobacter sp. Hiyo6]
MGRIIDKPWVVNGELAVRKVTELTLTFDTVYATGQRPAVSYVTWLMRSRTLDLCWRICDGHYGSDWAYV